ncbi:MAG: TIGR00375 family protein [Thermoplasmatales archaeon]|nr:MAG: TIGR00375 family protein [Thermoplasmatales archaeon]
MIINADLHIHSHYSGATSEKMNLQNIAFAAPFKGIDVVGTGDCLHRGWIKEIKKCHIIDEGTFEFDNTRFILSTEIEAQKKVHHLLYFPSFSSVEDFKEKISPKSKNIENDGRPNADMSGEELASIAKDVDALIGPAHAFTPYTSMYAHYDSLEACYGELADYVSFIELGLSADSNFADKIEELHKLTFLTNSDCHSPHPVRLAREFTRFEVKDVTFKEIKKAILRTGENRPLLNVGLPPQEGKYHESACRSCYTHYSLEEAQRRRWKCRCGKRIKKGVKDKINERATFEEPKHPNHRPPYIHLIPLSEIIAKAIGQKNPFTQTVTKRWNELISAFCSEIRVLLDVDIEYISKITAPAIAEAIQAFREKKVIIQPGGGGKYGIIELPKEGEIITVNLGPDDTQKALSDY